jgi:cytochrome P450
MLPTYPRSAQEVTESGHESAVPALSFSPTGPDGSPPEVLTHQGTIGLGVCPARVIILRAHEDVVSCLDEEPVGFDEAGDGFALTGAELQHLDGGLLHYDDPKFGRAIRPIFSARRVGRTRHVVEALASDQIWAVEPDERGVVDFKSYSHRFIATTVCAALGLQLADWPFILRSSQVAFGAIEGETGVIEARRAWQALYTFYQRVAQRKRVNPDNAIVSSVLNAFDARGFSNGQAVRTIATISNGFPAALPVLDLSMVELLARPKVVEECLRLPSRWQAAIAEFTAGRHPAVTPLVSGSESHFCPAAAHTILWLEAALRSFFQRFPQARLTEHEPLEWRPGKLSTPRAINVQVY